MNKKGFTLIELLAVIVILAIIALIATPIVLNIINETRDSAGLRGAEFYLDAVEQGILRSELKNKRVDSGVYNIINGELCLSTDTSKCITVEIDGEKPSSASITIENGNIKDVELIIENEKIIKNDNGEVIYFPCKLITGEENTIGSKYECEVKPGTKHNFYVLSYNDADGNMTTTKTDAVTTNLIMERNICRDGSYATDKNTCTVAWNSFDEVESYAPITSMDYLSEATKDWTNLTSMIVSKYEECNVDVALCDVLYFKDIGKTYTTYARMPYYSEVSDYDSVNRTNPYLYDYLAKSATNIQKNSISGVYGYWTLTNFGLTPPYSFVVGYTGIVIENSLGGLNIDITNAEVIGVRPVITIEL